MDLHDAISRLSRTPPSEFLKARTEIAKQAASEGDRSLADQIKKLKRPTRSAWAMNSLASERPSALRPLLELGQELRSAQASLSGDRLRSLVAKRREVVSELKRTIAENAEALGQRLNSQAEGEVEQTLEAALADPAAAEALESGRLTSALSHVGFADSGSLATKRVAGRSEVRGRKAVHRSKQRAEAALEALRKAEQELKRVRSDLDEAEAAVSKARRDVTDAEALVRTRRAEVRKSSG